MVLHRFLSPAPIWKAAVQFRTLSLAVDQQIPLEAGQAQVILGLETDINLARGLADTDSG